MQRTKRETIQSARSIDLIDIAFLRFQTKDKLFEPFLEKKKKRKREKPLQGCTTLRSSRFDNSPLRKSSIRSDLYDFQIFLLHTIFLYGFISILFLGLLPEIQVSIVKILL